MSNFNVSNLVPVSYDKVAKGTKAIKVGNQIFTFQNPMEFYKCVSVDEENKTWTGYKAVLVDSSYYYFQENITEGLIYLGNAVEVDNIYSSDGLVQIANLFNGLLNNE